MEIERAAGLAFARPRSRPGASTEMQGGRIALVVLPFLVLLLGLGYVATRAGERGDTEGTVRLARIAMGLLALGIVGLYAETIHRGRRRTAEPRLPFAARALVNVSNGGSSATGIVSLEDGALCFRGDTFDFRLPRSLIPEGYRAKDFIGLGARGLRLPLPKGVGPAVLRLTLEKTDRDALEEILASLTNEAEMVLPPIYRPAPAMGVRGGWWIVLLLTLAMAGVAVLYPGARNIALIPVGTILGWMHGPGLAWTERRTQILGERAFRKFQSRAEATP